MVDDTSVPQLAAHTERALAALLAVDATDAAAVRERSPARRRPRRQHGPVLDLGGPDPDGPADGSPGPRSDRDG